MGEKQNIPKIPPVVSKKLKEKLERKEKRYTFRADRQKNDTYLKVRKHEDNERKVKSALSINEDVEEALNIASDLQSTLVRDVSFFPLLKNPLPIIHHMMKRFDARSVREHALHFLSVDERWVRFGKRAPTVRVNSAKSHADPTNFGKTQSSGIKSTENVTKNKRGDYYE